MVQDEARYKDRYIIMAIILMGVFMSVLDTNVVNIALPTITQFFHVDVAQSQWVITSYLIVLTSFLLIFGRISEYTGKAKLYIAGFGIFTLSSLACGLSGSIQQLILFRAVQGIGASVALSIDMAILVLAFPPSERGRAISYLAMTIAIGSVAGPILGGYVVDLLGWQYVFLINVPVGILLIMVGLRYLKLDEPKLEKFSMDWAGGATLVLSIVSLMLLLGELAQRSNAGFMELYAAILAVSLVAFAYVESKQKSPIVDLSLFKIKKFTFSNISTLINYAAFAMFNVVMPFFMQMALGFKPSQIGQMLFIIPIAMAVSAPVSGWLYDRTQKNYHSVFGMLLMAIALLAVGYFAPTMTTAILLTCFAIYGIGNGLFLSTNNSEAMGSLPPHKSSSASSMLATVRNLGNSIGVSMFSIILYMSIAATGVATAVTTASPDVLSHAAGNVLMFGGLLCAIGVITTLLVSYK
jgi:EmrB/QacA subfamily drug resistance transporter